MYHITCDFFNNAAAPQSRSQPHSERAEHKKFQRDFAVYRPGRSAGQSCAEQENSNELLTVLRAVQESHCCGR